MLVQPSAEYGPNDITASFSVMSLILVLATKRSTYTFGTKQMLFCISSDGIVGWMYGNWVIKP